MSNHSFTEKLGIHDPGEVLSPCFRSHHGSCSGAWANGFVKWCHWRKLPPMGYPNTWMVSFMKNPIKMDDHWGYPHFWTTPYVAMLPCSKVSICCGFRGTDRTGGCKGPNGELWCAWCDPPKAGLVAPTFEHLQEIRVCFSIPSKWTKLAWWIQLVTCLD